MKKTVKVMFCALLSLLFLTSIVEAATEYTVKSGDVLNRIAYKLKVDKAVIIAANPTRIKAPRYWVFVGDKLTIPDGKVKSNSTPKKLGRQYINVIPEKGSSIKTVKVAKTPKKIEKSKGKITKPKTFKPRQLKKPKIMQKKVKQAKRVVRKNIKPVTSKLFRWKRPGGNKFKGNKWTAWRQNGLTQQQLVEMGKLYVDKKRVRRRIKNGDKFDSMSFGSQKVKKNVLVAWSGKKHKRYADVYILLDRTEIWLPDVCGNWAVKKSTPKIVKQIKPKQKVVKNDNWLNGLGVVALADPDAFAKGWNDLAVNDADPSRFVKDGVAIDKFGMYIGGGSYSEINNDADGYYTWLKMSYTTGDFHPFGEGLRVDIGASLNMGFGAGNDGDYKYNWERWYIGPEIKFTGKHYDAEVGFGLGELTNKGSIDLYKSWQKDDIFAVNLHYNNYARRDAGKEWFSSFEVNLNAIFPYSSEHEHSWDGNPLDPESFNSQTADITLVYSIYDLDIGKVDRITARANVGLGREFGNGQNFYQVGPSFVYSHNNKDIISASVLNYKEMLGDDGDQWQWFSIMISPSGIWKAYDVAGWVKGSWADD